MRLEVETIRETVERGMPKKQGKIIEFPFKKETASERESETVLNPPFVPAMIGRG